MVMRSSDIAEERMNRCRAKFGRIEANTEFQPCIPGLDARERRSKPHGWGVETPRDAFADRLKYFGPGSTGQLNRCSLSCL